MQLNVICSALICRARNNPMMTNGTAARCEQRRRDASFWAIVDSAKGLLTNKPFLPRLLFNFSRIYDPLIFRVIVFLIYSPQISSSARLMSYERMRGEGRNAGIPEYRNTSSRFHLIISLNYSVPHWVCATRLSRVNWLIINEDQKQDEYTIFLQNSILLTK